MLNSTRLALKFLWRDIKAGDWTIIIFSLVLAVSSITTLEFYTDRVTHALSNQSAKFIGGDLAITSSTPIDAEWLVKASDLNLKTAQVWSYPTVVTAHGKLQLVNLQAVSNNYPLIDPQPSPHALEAWVDKRLPALLNINIGANVSIGAATFKATKLLDPEVDALNTGFQIAPRIMINLSDVPATQTVVAGSRIEYRLLLAGEKQKIQIFSDWIAPRLTASQKLLTIKNQQSALEKNLQDAENYLQLALIICLLLNAVAIALSVQQYLRKHIFTVALLRSMGMQRQTIQAVLATQLFIIMLATAFVGILIGYLAQDVLAQLFNDYLQFSLPNPTSYPIYLGALCSFVLLASFSYPLVNDLPNTSPMMLWQNTLVINYQKHQFFYLIAGLFLILFTALLTHFSMLAFMFLNIMAVVVCLLYVLSLCLFSFIKKISVFFNGSLRQGLKSLIQYPDITSLQFTGLTLILVLLMTLGMLRSDLVERWRASIPTNSPNYFAFNLAPNDLASFQTILSTNHIKHSGLYPMVRGRLIGLNGKDVLSVVSDQAKKNNALNRELNLSWMTTLPMNNHLVSGTLWTTKTITTNALSVEYELAKQLGLKLGDTLTFRVEDKLVSGKITNFRSVQWTSFSPNFFVIFQPGPLNSFAATYVTSFHLSTTQTTLLNTLVEQFPNITILDVANILSQLQTIIKKITYASQYLFLFSLVAGVLIFIASVQTGLDERKKAYALWRILGASNQYIYTSICVEYSTLALMITATSIGLANGIVWILEMNLFGL